MNEHKLIDFLFVEETQKSLHRDIKNIGRDFYNKIRKKVSKLDDKALVNIIFSQIVLCVLVDYICSISLGIGVFSKEDIFQKIEDRFAYFKEKMSH